MPSSNSAKFCKCSAVYCSAAQCSADRGVSREIENKQPRFQAGRRQTAPVLRRQTATVVKTRHSQIEKAEAGATGLPAAVARMSKAVAQMDALIARTEVVLARMADPRADAARAHMHLRFRAAAEDEERGGNADWLTGHAPAGGPRKPANTALRTRRQTAAT